MSIASETLAFIDGGIKDDDKKFREFGVDPFETTAMPYYARWVRQDLIGMYYMMNKVARYARIGLFLLALIAAPLWIIALR